MSNQADQIFLESLFSQARERAPVLEDDSFSAKVMEDFPFEQHLAHNAEQLKKISANLLAQKKPKRISWFDVAGLSLGLLACFSFIDPAQVLTMVSNFLPGKLVISPVALVSGGVVAVTALAFSAWYALEGEASNRF